jgi:hypothetical protein
VSGGKSQPQSTGVFGHAAACCRRHRAGGNRLQHDRRHQPRRIDDVQTTPAEWAALFIEAQRCSAEGFPAECQELGGDGWTWYRSGLLPYWVLVEDDVVIAINEQYLP